MSKEDGGPAFPFGQTDELSGQLVNGWGSEGMTLRDYFAAKATDEDIKPYMTLDRFMSRQRARYMHADGMLVERAK